MRNRIRLPRLPVLRPAGRDLVADQAPALAPAEFMAGYRRYALRLVAMIVAASTAVALAESYRALYLWAAHHGVPGRWAYAWPAMVDSFVVTGELALFVGLVDGWKGRHRAWAWLVTFGGLAVSVGGNVGHIGPAPWADRLTASVPPVAAFVALTVALGVLKRVAARAASVAAEAVKVAELPPVDLGDVARRAVLGAAETDAQRVRYAVGQGCRPEVGQVREWLLFYGYDVSEVNIMSVLRRLNGNGNGSVNGANYHGVNGSGELEKLTA